MLLQGIKQGAGKTEVALHELFLVLRAVDACEVENEVAVLAPLVKLLGGAVEVVLIDCLDGNGRMGLVLACLYVLQCPAEVLADKPLGTCYKYFHNVTLIFISHRNHGNHRNPLLPHGNP